MSSYEAHIAPENPHMRFLFMYIPVSIYIDLFMYIPVSSTEYILVTTTRRVLGITLLVTAIRPRKTPPPLY